MERGIRKGDSVYVLGGKIKAFVPCKECGGVAKHFRSEEETCHFNSMKFHRYHCHNCFNIVTKTNCQSYAKRNSVTGWA